MITIGLDAEDYWVLTKEGAEPERIKRPDSKRNENLAVFDNNEEDRRWGFIEWACKKRNEQPQHAIVLEMKRDGAWSENMESLPPNEVDNRTSPYPVPLLAREKASVLRTELEELRAFRAGVPWKAFDGPETFDNSAAIGCWVGDNSPLKKRQENP